MNGSSEAPATFESATFRYPVAPRGRQLLLLSVAALGIVYGDIGTSPLYALRVCFSGRHAVPLQPENVLGVLSLIFWTLLLVVGVKYHAWILRLDNRGEGGILALMGLIRLESRGGPAVRRGILLLGVLGVALFYGDGIMTPAISVLSAVEGLELVSPVTEALVAPVSVGLLVFLFITQRRGTARIGRVFGPLMFLWFVTIAALGVAAIARRPDALAAVDPRHAIRFFSANALGGFLILGVVFLVAAGGEALYADMGRFGKKPMRIGWLALVLPALVLNYFGQGALLLSNPAAARNPFYLLAPRWAILPLVGLATIAALIAAQAVISGAFSLTRQAVQLGYLPRVRIVHTSRAEMGQISISGVSWAGMLGTIGVIVLFQTSTRLADAYGVAIAMAMAVTTLLAYGVSREVLGWSGARALLATAFFLAIDLVFVGANLVKVPHGGWVSLAAAAVTFTAMTTWRRGRRIVSKRLEADTLPLDVFLDGVARKPRLRVPGTAIFMDRVSSGTPPALLQNLRHNKAMHERVVFLTVETEPVPFVSRRKRMEVETLKEGFYRITLRYGFMQDPDVPRALENGELGGRKLDLMDTTFFLGRETLIPHGALGMAVWREKLFALMSRNATSAMAFFRLPPNRVIELGAQIEI
ncbi:MAG: potassium transporter Kup [Acidobacteria bacterium]|nr:MAG: potassium transporter Kup [Acidobacteriota bacterium]PYQ66012.1 MAG: potassium transporter Kup [Acidobacteriota bacterium]